MLVRLRLAPLPVRPMQVVDDPANKKYPMPIDAKLDDEARLCPRNVLTTRITEK